MSDTGGEMNVTGGCLPRPESDHHRLLATLVCHGRLAVAATLFSTAVRTTGALSTLLAALCAFPSLLRVVPSVLLLVAPTAAATFRVLTSALCRARRPSAAADLLRCMPSLLLNPHSPQCHAVLSSLCRCAPALDAAAFLHDMCRWGVPPSRADHHAVLRTLLRDRIVAEAYEAVKEGMDLDGVAPDTGGGAAGPAVGLVGAGGARRLYVADAHGLLLEVFLHGGCAPRVDASTFTQLICPSKDCALLSL